MTKRLHLLRECIENDLKTSPITSTLQKSVSFMLSWEIVMATGRMFYGLWLLETLASKDQTVGDGLCFHPTRDNKIKI